MPTSHTNAPPALTVRQRVALGASLAFVLLLYLLFPTRNYYWDGITFAATIERARGYDASLIHPNHLLYNVFGRALYDLAGSLGGARVRALTILRTANSLISVACALVLFDILRRVTRSFYVSLSLALLFAFSAVWWKFSIDANSYIPSVLPLLLCFRLLPPANAEPRPLRLALAHTAAMMFHQLAVFFFPVAIYGLYVQSARGERSRTLAAYALPAFAMTFGAYVAGFYLQHGFDDPSFFTRWITNYSPDASFTFGFVDNLFYSSRGNVRLIASGKPSLAWRAGGAANMILLAGFAVIAALLVLRGARAAWRSKALRMDRSRLTPELRLLARIAALWAIIYLIFLFFWLPHNTFYRLFYLPALVLLAAVPLAARAGDGSARRAGATGNLALFVAAIALFNFVALTLPFSRIENNEPLRLAYDLRERWSRAPAPPVVLYAAHTTDNEMFRYFVPSVRWRQLNDITPADVESTIGAERDAREPRVDEPHAPEVWLEVTALDRLRATPEAGAWLAARVAETVKLDDPRYHVEFVRLAAR